MSFIYLKCEQKQWLCDILLILFTAHGSYFSDSLYILLFLLMFDILSDIFEEVWIMFSFFIGYYILYWQSFKITGYLDFLRLGFMLVRATFFLLLLQCLGMVLSLNIWPLWTLRWKPQRVQQYLYCGLGGTPTYPKTIKPQYV